MEDNKRLKSENKKLRKALIRAHQEIVDYEFQTGIIRDGEYWAGGLSDAECLLRAMRLNPSDVHDMTLVLSLLPKVARRRALRAVKDKP